MIRPERRADEAGIRRVNEAAFGRPAEADLVDALRAAGAVIGSLVAEEEGEVVGHILFSPATLASHSESGANPLPDPDEPNGVAESGWPQGPIGVSPSAPPQALGVALGEGEHPIAALGPMAVLPAWQGRGVGSQLVRAGLDVCRAAGYDLVIVLGHRDYYPRFGFQPAPPLGIRWEHGADRNFMVQALRPGALAGAGGVVRYRPEFDGV
jgi:putative acetyltransferase